MASNYPDRTVHSRVNQGYDSGDDSEEDRRKGTEDTLPRTDNHAEAVDNVGQIVRKMTAKKSLSKKVSHAPADTVMEHSDIPPEYCRERRMTMADKLRRMSNVLHDVPDDESEIEEEEISWRKRIWKYRGYFYTLMSSIIHSFTALLAKWLEVYDATNLTLWKCQGVLLPAIPLLCMYMSGREKRDTFDVEQKPEGSTKNWSKLKIFAVLLIRSVISINSLLLHFYSLEYLDLGVALVVASTSPIFTYFFAFFLLGEPCGIVPMLMSLVTISGVVVIIRPPMPWSSGEQVFDYNTLIGVGLALGCTLLGTISFVFLRYLRRVHHSLIMFGYGAWGTFEMLTMSLLLGVFQFPHGSQHWILATIIAVLSAFGQFGIILALKAEASGPVSLVRTLDIIFGFIWQILFWQIFPDLYSLIGATIIIFGVVVTGFRKWLASLPENNSTRNRFWFVLC